MNRVTNAERQRILTRALNIVKIDARTSAVANSEANIRQLMAEFGISRDRAMGAVAKAARIQRGKMRY